MAGKSLTEKLRNGILVSTLSLGMLAGCGSPPKTVSQTLISEIDPQTGYVGIEYEATSNDLPLERRMTYNGNLFGTNPTAISNSPFHQTFSKVLMGNYSSTVTSSSGKTDTKNLTIQNLPPEAKTSSLGDINDKYEEKRIDLGLTDPNFEHNPVNITNATSLDGKLRASFEGSELIVRGVPGSSGAYQIEVKFENNVGESVTKVYSGNVTEVSWQVAFWSRRDDNGGFCDEGDSCNEDIYLINEDRTGEVRLTTHPGQDLEPAFSPDGKEILFTSHRTGGTAVWRMNADGINQRDITSNIVERARQADWCSNGLIVVAYRDKGDSEAGIGIIDLNANSFTSIYSQPNRGGIPEWPSCSPDASEIAFTRHVGNWEVYKMNANGSDLTNITNNPAIDGIPDWSPDGNEMVFRSYRSGTADIYRMNSNGSNVIPLTSALGIETEPKYSADGTKIIFTHDIDLSNPQIYIMNSDGTGGWALLTTIGQNSYPAWRPW